jgi:hypothetical protein
VRTLLAFLLLTCLAYPQAYDHRVTAAFGGAIPAAGSYITDYNTSPAFSILYGYRFSRYGQFDFGADVTWGSYKGGIQPGSTGGTRMHYIVPTGYRAILPLWNDRIEASLGAGGAYVFYSPNPGGFNSWLVYGLLETNYALDEDQRYRAGILVKWYRDPIGAPMQQWVNVGGAFSISFGR